MITPEQYDEMQARLRKHDRTPVPTDAIEDGMEYALHYDIIAYCKSKGWVYFRSSPAGKTSRQPGEPDFEIFADGGRTLLIECKTKSGVESPEQLGVRIALERLGHHIYVIRSYHEFLNLVIPPP